MVADIDRSSALAMGHLSQIFLCLYGARFSYVAITNLRKYEETTKKAAKWSKTVEEHLYLTRTTQATGALCLILSFVSATTMLSVTKYLPNWLQLGVSPTVLVATMAMRHHIKSYWAPYKKDGKDVAGSRPPLPLMEDYDHAEFMTGRLLEVLSYLEYSWLATSFFMTLGFRL